MTKFKLYFAAALLAGLPSMAQPVIGSGGVVNAASFAMQSLPNSGIAQGSVFSIFGTGLGPVEPARVSAFPLPTDLGNSSVSVTVNGTTVKAILFYVQANQINALMPSNTPIGSGTLSVTANGQISASAPVKVVAENVGIFTVASSGSGPGVFTNGSNQANSFVLAANPGEILNIWATGLGAISAPDDQVPTTGNIGPAPTVYVGGATVKPGYWGRSGCCSGVNQIQIQIPQNVTGCTVPVAVQTGNTVSNFVSISVAASGRTCSDAQSGLSGSEYQKIISGSGSIGSVNLSRSTSTVTLPPPIGSGSPEDMTNDYGFAGFLKYTFSSSNVGGLPFTYSNYGACTVYYFNGNSSSGPTGSYQSVGLDAGSAITINGPNGTKKLTSNTTGFYSAALGADPVSGASGPLYLSPGAYQISGPGGSKVGPFQVNLQVPDILNWTNKAAAATVTRANGLPLTWTGGDANGLVVIEGTSLAGADESNLSGGAFICTAKASDLHFTVPPVVLLSLPPSAVISAGGFSIPTGSVILINSSNPVAFNANGLDYGFATSSISIQQSTTFK
jgi:uncharacterized protein (TIGR03437 family)